MPTYNLEDCLSKDEKLARFAGHANRLLLLRRLFAQHLPESLAHSAHVANFRLGCLMIHADNAAVANKLKQLVPSLLQALSQALNAQSIELTAIKIDVQIADSQHHCQPTAKALPFSGQARAGLNALANSLPADSPLRRSLAHFVQRA